MNTVFTLIIIFILIILAYYGVVHIIKLWTGCDEEEAVAKLHNLINGKAVYSFENDFGFENAVSENIRNIIGEKRYNQLIKLSKTAISTPLLSYGYYSGLPYIAISLYYEDDNEKQVLENILTNLVYSYLRIYGYNTNILVDWKIRPDLKMPYLLIRYARTKEEQRIIEVTLQNGVKSIIDTNTDVTDDTEDDDLND